MADNGSNLVRLGGLWAKKDKNGNTFLSGKMGMAQILIFVNSNKEPGSKQPDYNMYVAKPLEPEERDKRGPVADPLADNDPRFDNVPPLTDDDVPFG